MSEDDDTRTKPERSDPRRYGMLPGEMPATERAELANSLPRYLTRAQAAELAAVDVRTIDRWRRWWAESFEFEAQPSMAGQVGLKTYYSRATRVDMSDQPPGEIRVSKVQLLERIGFDPNTALRVETARPVRTIADVSREMFGS